MVFHRFLAGEVPRPQARDLGERLHGRTPGTRSAETSRQPSRSPSTTSRGASETGIGIVHVRPYVLPDKSEFSDSAAWQRASGPLKWNRQQGLYIYRANRLIQWGGWSRLRTIDEHSKLARMAVDFTPSLDAAFGINISKAIVKLPADLHEELEPVVSQVVRIADAALPEGRQTARARGRLTIARAPALAGRHDTAGRTQPRSDPGGGSPPEDSSEPWSAAFAGLPAHSRHAGLSRKLRAMPVSRQRWIGSWPVCGGQPRRWPMTSDGERIEAHVQLLRVLMARDGTTFDEALAAAGATGAPGRS